MSLASVLAVTPHPKGFRSRRALNWISLGLLYASFYMCRYNFRFAIPGIMQEFHFSTSQITDIMAIWALAYGTGQLFNGLLADRIGGKLSLLIGGVGTIIVNLVFGCTSLASNFATFTLIWLINGIVQAEGPGMVKINTAWFDRRERGTFSGIYGLVIQSGQVAISHIAPLILAGFTIFAFTVPPGEWRWLFRIPPMFTAVTAILMAIFVKQTPDEAGYPGAIHDEIDDSAGVTVPLLQSLKTILTHPLVWFYAVAYGCTGAVRSSSD
ncbi:MAG: MFS transporter, partial [Verrucomicrobia bacterium]|nr:MFS transporter [Verrucomicrobiota bacterium]